MAAVLVRDLDASVVEKLKARWLPASGSASVRAPKPIVAYFKPKTASDDAPRRQC
jgi:hypothetical protein